MAAPRYTFFGWIVIACTKREIQILTRYTLRVKAVDMDSTKKENPTFAEFMLFGLEGAIGTGANYASSPTREETGQVPCKISDVEGKKLTVIMSPISKSLDSGYSHFHVHQNRAFKQVTVCAVATERSISTRKCRPTSFSASNTSSYTSECQNVFVTLSPPIGTTSGKNEEVRPCQNEDSDLTNVEQGTKRQITDDPPCGSDLKRRAVQSDKPNCGNK